MKLPRKGILIRIVIYGGLFGYLGYAALMRFQAERELENGTIQDQLEAQEGKPTRMVTLPDGTQMPVYEITQEEYDAMFDKVPGETGADSASGPAAADPSDGNTEADAPAHQNPSATDAATTDEAGAKPSGGTSEG